MTLILGLFPLSLDWCPFYMEVQTEKSTTQKPQNYEKIHTTVFFTKSMQKTPDERDWLRHLLPFSETTLRRTSLPFFLQNCTFIDRLPWWPKLLEKRLLRFSWTTPRLGLDELASGHVHSHIQLEHSSEPAMLLSLTRWSLLQSCSVSRPSKIFDVLVVMRTQYEQSKSVRHTVRMIDTVSLISGFLSFVINFGKAVSSHVILLLVIISANMSGDVD